MVNFTRYIFHRKQMFTRPQNALSISIYSFMVVLLSGCATGNHIVAKQRVLNLDQMNVGTDFTARQTQHSNDHMAWWTTWQDPQLNRLMQLIDGNPPSLEIAQARFDRALALLDLSQTNRQVQGGVSAAATADRYPDHSTYPDTYAGKTGSSGNLLLSLSWHLDFWGKWKALNQANASNIDAAEFAIQDAQLSLHTAIASNYLQWYMTNELVNNQRRHISILKRLVELTKQKRNAGLATNSMVIQAQLNLLTQQKALPELQRKVHLYRHTIATLLGQPPSYADNWSAPQLRLKPELKVITPLPLNWIGQRPDIQLKRKNLEAMLSMTEVARASFYPDIDLTAVVGLQSLGLDYLFRAGSRTAAIGPAINLPIFEQNRLRAELKSKVADYDEAIAQYNQNLLIAIQQTTDHLQQLNTATQQRVLSVQSANASSELRNIQRELLKKGLSTQQDELLAELNQLEKAVDLIQINQQMTMTQIKLTHSLGGYWAFSTK